MEVIIALPFLNIFIGGEYEDEAEYNNVEVYMSFARKKLAYVESGCEIKAVRGIGYELRQRDVR